MASCNSLDLIYITVFVRPLCTKIIRRQNITLLEILTGKKKIKKKSSAKHNTARDIDEQKKIPSAMTLMSHYCDS